MFGTYVLRRRVAPAALLTLALMLSACGQASQPAASRRPPQPRPSPPRPPSQPPRPRRRPSRPSDAAKPAAPAAGGAAATDQGACTEANATKARPSGRGRFVIGTGGTGGVFFPYGGGLARILTAQVAEHRVDGRGDRRLGRQHEADPRRARPIWACRRSTRPTTRCSGHGVYKDTGPIPGCTIAVLYQSFVHVVALDGSRHQHRRRHEGQARSRSARRAAAPRARPTASSRPPGSIRRPTSPATT